MNAQGDFIWYELMTTNMEGARAFYGAFGLEISPQSDMPGQDYRMIRCGDSMIGGVMALDDDMLAHGAMPLWTSYIAVADVDTTAAAILDKGGHVFLPPRDIPGVGRFAMVGDPQGATFYIMRGDSGESSTVFADGPVGHWGWNELWAPDPAAALAFYGALFGWRQEGGMPMGPAGEYAFLKAGDLRIGAIGPRGAISPGKEIGPAAFWRHYFRLPSIGSAAETILAGGGEILDGPHDVPGDDTIIVARDPQGAQFALVGKR